MQDLIYIIEQDGDSTGIIKQLVNIIDEFQQCLYHLKMIFLSSECFDEKIVELIDTLEKFNIAHSDEFELLVYDSPYKVVNRRNEVIVILK